MKKVISFCLFGVDERYTIGAIKNAKLAKQYMPDWECWFYVAKNVPEEIIRELEEVGNTKIIHIKRPHNFTFTLARFLVFTDKTVERAIIRDTDARISARDILCINEWIESDLDFHIIKDHPTGHSAVMSAGMWGAKADALRNINEIMDMFLNVPAHLDVNRNQRGVDQEFLGEKIYPIAIESCLYHSEYYHCKIKGNSIQKRFPSPDRYPDNHIGAALDKDDNYVYKVDGSLALSKNGNTKYIYDFDLLEKND